MSHQMDDTEATDEAVLLLTRKLRRLHPAAYADIMSKLPAGARDALNLADVRADRLRDQTEERSWPQEEELEEED